MTPFLALQLRDPYSAVRMIAKRSLAKQPEANRLVGYEPMGSPESWIQRTDPVYAAWAARKRPASPALLIDGSGGLDMNAFQLLLSRRDDRPLVLNE
jgi:hypothetical protein